MTHALTSSLLAGCLLMPLQAAQDPQHSMPPGMSHEEHMRQMGAAAMGFDQTTTTHHFHLTPDGGIIEVVTKKADDAATQAEIRAHLQEIAREFTAGDFQKPLAVHGEMPPGVATMQRRHDAIAYTYEEEPAGGRVLIATADPSARDAVHQFLRYQIREHKTGDSLDVRR